MLVETCSVTSFERASTPEALEKEGVSPMHSSKALSRGRILGAVTGAAVAVLGFAGAAVGQTVDSEQLPAVKNTQGKAQEAAQAPAPQGGGGDVGLRDRVEQLEGQLVDLQVVIGTLESLARTGGAAP